MTIIKVKSRGTDNVTGRKNLFINGDMQIAQRGASTSFAHDGTTSDYCVDRFRLSLGGTHEQLDGTYAQVADHPTSVNGKSLKWTTGTAESSYDADEYAYFVQVLEGQNAQHLQYGNSNAQTITISFYVKSSITGTYALGLYKPDSTARIFNKTYTISSANTWEKKTVTFVGDTGGGGIVNDNGQGLWVTWHLAAGANAKGASSSSGWVNYAGLSNWADGQGTNAVMTTASATWQMTECQVEIGSTSTDFEHRSFAEELKLCERYFYMTYPHGATIGAASGESFLGRFLDGTQSYGSIQVPNVNMRAAPTKVIYNTATGTVSQIRTDTQNVAAGITGTGTKGGGWIYVNAVSVGTSVSVKAHLTMDAEL